MQRETNNPPRTSRRDFAIRTSAGLAAASGLSLARSVHAAGSDELKVALIGCGSRGTGAAVHCLMAGPNIKLIAVADAFRDRADSCLAHLRKDGDVGGKIDVPEDRVFIGLDAYQQAIAAGPDLVLLATPTGFRPIHYAAAINAGKHVFMEKPVCVDAPGFRLVMETNKLADERSLKVVVGLHRRHSKPYQAKVQEIRDGAIGKILMLRAYWNMGPMWVRNREPGQTEMEFQLRNWYYFVWLSGDFICEGQVHKHDVANWVMDDHPVTANGMGGCHLRDNRGLGQTFDSFCVEYTYKDGTKLFSQCRQQPDTWPCVEQAVHGVGGVRQLPTDVSDGFYQEHIDLVDAIRNNQRLNDGWYGATSTFTSILGRMAAYSGKEVHWEEAAAKGPSELPERLAFDANPRAMPDKDGNYPMPIPGVYQPY